MDPPSAQVAAREAFARGDWRAARDGWQAAAESGELAPADLDHLSRATWMLGDVSRSLEQAEQAFTGYVREGNVVEAADLALRLTVEWSSRGDLAISTAWLARARRLLENTPAGPTSGYLRYTQALLSLEIEGDAGPAGATAEEIDALATEFDDPALTCFSRVLRGVAAIRAGRTEDAFASLDEAMLPVVAGQVDPLWAGDVYCSVIHICEGLADLARMRAWTDALARWVRPLPDELVYAGVTRVHRLQLLGAEGDWDEVENAMAATSEHLTGIRTWVAGAGYVELGDVRRLRGDTDGARHAYTLARGLGVDPQPGEAELLLTEGRATEALDGLLGALGAGGRLERARLLLPAVEVAVHSGDLDLADRLTTDLADTAAYFTSPGLTARAHQAHAVLLLARSRPAEALPHLEAALQTYREQRYRHATARVHEQLAVAHAALADHSASSAASATARAIYARLGAAPDVARLAARTESGRSPGGLTPREVEVLAAVSAGASNRAVAAELYISEKTVGRHLANIFVKIDVSSRTAAAAWAHDHGLAGT